jgi:hypothetical protein
VTPALVPDRHFGGTICSMAAPWPVLILLAALASGCQAPSQPSGSDERWYESVVEPLQSDVSRALGFYDRIIRLKGVDLAREHEVARQSFEREKSELNRLQLAMMLSLPAAGFRDEQAASQLLQPFLRDKNLQESPLRPLALLLNVQIAEVRKLDDALQQQGIKAKEEQRRAEDLQQKLDALLEMEKKLIEREQTLPTKKK